MGEEQMGKGRGEERLRGIGRRATSRESGLRHHPARQGGKQEEA